VIDHTNSGAVLAHVGSLDLIHWDYLPPIDAPTGKFSVTEVPDFFELNGRYYFLFSSSSLYGIHHNIPTRDDAVGTYYMVGNSMEGPYHLLKNYLLVGTGQGNVVSYVGRTIPYQNGRLLYHHINSGPDLKTSRHTWGSPKRILQMEDGSLALQYLPVLGKLETGAIYYPINNSDPLDNQDLGIWKKLEGKIVGSAIALGSACKVEKNISDVHLTCRINSETALRAGVVLRSANSSGVLITLNYEQQRLEIGTASYHPSSGWGTGLKELLAGQGSDLYKDIFKIQLMHDQDYTLRCFARDEHFEVYLDDQWIFTTVLKKAALLGDIELYVSGGQAWFSDLRIAIIEPLG
jgi:sucrose-6-phosphate hydrolase SacC (GH32 family)